MALSHSLYRGMMLSQHYPYPESFHFYFKIYNRATAKNYYLAARKSIQYKGSPQFSHLKGCTSLLGAVLTHIVTNIPLFLTTKKKDYVLQLIEALSSFLVIKNESILVDWCQPMPSTIGYAPIP